MVIGGDISVFYHRERAGDFSVALLSVTAGLLHPLHRHHVRKSYHGCPETRQHDARWDRVDLSAVSPLLVPVSLPHGEDLQVASVGPRHDDLVWVPCLECLPEGSHLVPDTLRERLDYSESGLLTDRPLEINSRVSVREGELNRHRKKFAC